MEKYKITVVDDCFSSVNEHYYELNIEQPHKVKVHEVTGQIIIYGTGGTLISVYPATIIFEHLKSDDNGTNKTT